MIQNTTNNSLISPDDTFQQFLDYLKSIKESGIEDVVGDTFVVFAEVGKYRRVYHFTAIQYAFLMLTIRFFLGIVIGLIIGKIGKLVLKWYEKSKLKKFVLEIRAGADEFTTQLVELYFPDNKDYIYILDVRYQRVKRCLLEAVKYGSITYGISKIAGNVIWIEDRYLMQLLTKDIITWGLMRDAFSGYVDNNPIFSAFAALTETNARVAAAVQISGHIATGAAIGIMAGGVMTGASTLATLQALTGSAVLVLGQFVFIRYVASLKFIFNIIKPYIGMVFYRRTNLEKIEPQFDPSFPTDKLETFTDKLRTDEISHADDILVLSGSDRTLQNFKESKTLGDLAESETRTSIRKRGLDRLSKTKDYIKGRYGSIKEYFFPSEKEPIWVKDNNYFNPYDGNPANPIE